MLLVNMTLVSQMKRVVPNLLRTKEEIIKAILKKPQRVSLRQGYLVFDPNMLIETEEYITIFLMN